jgi:tubulin polyglutamylase TTLL1/tubulin monoglycylase TTLL3/8
MLTSINGNLKGYTYEEGYLRTCVSEYSLKNLSNRYVHLTNDAIQKKSEDYGKFEPGNKMGYEEFQRYLDKYHAS